jgi:hypothetical protein
MDLPTAMNLAGYRFFFYSMEGSEPPHIHVERGAAVDKFWLGPVNLANSRGFRSQELTRIRAMVIGRRIQLEDKWHAHFGD